MPLSSACFCDIIWVYVQLWEDLIVDTCKLKKYKFNNRVQCVREFELKSPEGLVIILHGMSEHGGRYEKFALFLKDMNLAVWVPDHRQHGRSVSHDKVGIFSKEDSFEAMLEDIQFIYTQAVEKYPNVPVYLLGHSMGTMLSRAFIQNYQPNLTKVVLIGSPSFRFSGIKPLKVFCKLKASLSNGRSHLLGNATFNNYNARVENSKTKFDWLSCDENEVQKYIDDELCGYDYNARFYEQLANMLLSANSEENMTKFPDVPVLFLYGSDDPVGGYGEGAELLANKYNDLGKNFILCEYEGMRHELLNELEKEDVYHEIGEFLSGEEK